MKSDHPLWFACRFCGGCAASFALWTLWLFLGVLLVLQLYVLSVHRLAVPAFLVRALEERLAASRLAVRFDHAAFDPSGRIVAENITLSSPSFSEPLVTARALYVRLDPWALLAGHFDPREVRIADASLFVPALLSPSGRAEPLVSDCTFDLMPRDGIIRLAQFSCHLGGLAVTAHGALRLPAGANTAATGALPLADLFAQNYPPLSRRLAGFTARLAALEEPRLHLELTPSDTHGALVAATLDARALRLDRPWSVQVTGLRAVAQAPLLGKTAGLATLDLAAAGLSLPGRARAQAVRIHLRGVVWPSRPRFVPREIYLSAANLDAASLHAVDFFAHGTPEPLPRLHAMVVMLLGGEPVALDTDVDLKAKSARTRFDAAIAPALVAPLSTLAHIDAAQLLKLTSPLMLDGRVEIAPGGRLASLSTRLCVEHPVAQGVPLDAVSARIDFLGQDLRVTDIVLRQHDNLALGSYTMDTVTRDYRFLLQGRLRPLEVAPWFAPSWTQFWTKFDFAAGPADADVDVRGRWGAPDLTDVFVFADARSFKFRDIPLDRVRILLRWQPDLYDCRELFVAQGARTARGRFTRSIDLAKDSWRDMEFDGTSNLDLTASGQMIAGQDGVDFVAPFQFAQPPTLHVVGRLDSPVAPGGEHQRVQIAVASTGAFSLFDFPLTDVSFDAVLRDDDIDLPRISATFASGTLSGRAFLSGPDNARRLRFDLHLANASLGRAVTTVDDFISRQKKLPPDPPTRFIQRAADISLDLAAAADGRYHDPLSFTGSGTAAITGAELGQIRLLGSLIQVPLLKQLLNVASLRFTAAHASFDIDQTKLAFSEVKVTGANSAVDAKGDYLLDRKTLDFNAKIYPFKESKFPITNIVGTVLTPISAALEVKLTGTLDKPDWVFAYSPTNFLRKLAEPKTSQPPAKTPPAASPAGENRSP